MPTNPPGRPVKFDDTGLAVPWMLQNLHYSALFRALKLSLMLLIATDLTYLIHTGWSVWMQYQMDAVELVQGLGPPKMQPVSGCWLFDIKETKVFL